LRREGRIPAHVFRRVRQHHRDAGGRSGGSTAYT
jgi:hypothetical protein